MNIKPIFPAFLYEELINIDCSSLVDYSFRLKEQRPGFHKNGWQSGHIDHTVPELGDLMSAIETKIPILKEMYGFSDNAVPRISDAWININEPGPQTSHNAEPHLHANHWVSFVFYPRACPESGKLILINPTAAVEYAVPTGFIEQDTDFNNHRLMIYPITGLLVAFPSWIMHYVEPNFSSESRISIAVNITLNHVNARFVT